MNDTINNFLNAIEARANAATVGPWRWANKPNMPPKVFVREQQGFVAQLGYPHEGKRELNAAFIAASRTDVPTLVAMLRDAIASLEAICVCTSERQRLIDAADHSLARIGEIAKGARP